MQPAITRAFAAECMCGGGGDGRTSSGGGRGGGESKATVGNISGGEGGGGEDAGVLPTVTDSVLATLYHVLKLCSTKALMVTLLAVDEGVKERLTVVLALGSVWP